MSLRYALRSLRSRPAYTLVVVATIALVVGPGAAVLAVVDATLVRALPFARSEQLVQVNMFPPGARGAANRNPLGSIDFVRFRERVHGLDALAGLWARERAIGSDGDPESVPMALVSANLFDVLGATPVLGRTFTEDEDRDGARIAVLSYGLWQRRFARDPAVVGKRLTIDREDYEVIGVMGPSFQAAYVTSDLWTPLGIHAGNMITPLATFIQSVGRLRSGTTLPQLQAELSAVTAAVARESPDLRGGYTTDVMSLRDAQFGAARPALFILLAAILATLLIACANLINLTVAEGASRRGELSLRAALGAGRGDLIRLYATESVVLAAAGGIGGLLLAAWILPAVLALDPGAAPTLGLVRIDWRIQAVASVLALALSLIASGVPALAATRGDTARDMASGSRRTAGSPRQLRLRFLLVTAETTLAVLLLTSGALLLNAYRQSSGTHPGFDPHQVLSAQLRLPVTAYPTPAARAQFVTTTLDRVRAIPGVISASTTHNLFIPGFTFVTRISIDGKPSPDGRPYTVQFRRISPDYFQAMRIPELGGRTFDQHDTGAGQPVAVVSRLLAATYWPGEDPIGRRIIRNGTPLTVVGVVGDVSDAGFSQPPAPTIYVAYAQDNVPQAAVGLVVRASGDPWQLVSAIKAAVREVDPAQPLSNITTTDTFLDASLGPERFRSVVLLAFAVLGLLLASVGIYGVTSRGVAERTRELGVRLALGCPPTAVRRLVLVDALKGVAVGFIAGTTGAGAADLALRHWLTGLSTTPITAALPALGALAVAAFISAAIPAARAGRVDPVVSIRSEA